MHLAVVTPFPPTITGIGQYGYYVTQWLCQSGAFQQVSVLTERVVGVPSLDQCISSLRIERIWWRDNIHAGRQVVARLRQIKPDIIWYNLAFSGFGRTSLVNTINLLTTALIRAIRLPYVITLHELAKQADLYALGIPHHKWAHLAIRLLTSLIIRADIICVPLRHYAQSLINRCANRIIHIPLGTYAPPQLLPEVNSRNILMFATFAPFKGLETLISAFKVLHARDPLLHLTIAGPEHPRFPGYLRSLQQTCADLPAIRWLGYVPETEVRTIFTQATVVVIPYTATVGASSALYWSLTWGRPVVVSDLPELRATTHEEGLAVTFFRSGDVRDLVVKLTELLANPMLRWEQSLHNYQICSEQLTPEHTCRSYIQAFNLGLTIHQSRSGLSHFSTM